MFQEAARLQGGSRRQPSFNESGHDTEKKLPLDKKQRFFKYILGSGLRGVRVGS